ncbi:hypothetical protein Tco_0490531 [Tanacetum coccineum]
MNALSFYRMETDEISERYIAQCFVNTLEAFDGEINLAFDENLISYEFAVKLCLDYEVKKGKKFVKKELIVALKGELYFVKFIINPEEDDFVPGVILGRSFLRLSQGIVDFGNGMITIYPEPDPFEDDSEKTRKSSDDWDQLLDFNFDDVPKSGEELPGKEQPLVIETMAYNDKYKKILDEIWKDKVELDGKTVKEDEEAVKRIKGETLKEKDDPAESDSDDEEEYVIKRNKFEAPIYGPRTAPYQNCANPEDRSSAIQEVTNPFRKISVWKKAVSFLGSLPVPLKQVNRKPDYKSSYTKEEEATRQWRTEIRLADPYENIYLQGFTKKKTDRKLTKLQEHTMTMPDHHDPNAQEMKPWKSYCFHKFTTSFCYGKDVPEMLSLEIDDMLRIRVREAKSEVEIFTSMAWIRAFNINEAIYAKLCHKFYSTYEFDEFTRRLGLYQAVELEEDCFNVYFEGEPNFESDHRLGLYQAVELEEDGFNVYFEGGLRSDDNFNITNYWLSISREENLSLSRSHTSTIRNPILRVIHKMITYGLCQRTTGYDKVQKNDLWLLSMFDARHQNRYANVAWVIAKWIKRKGAGTQKEGQICCGQDLIDSDGKLIPEDPQPGVTRVGIPRPSRASMQDLYDRMGHMEIHQDAIERMEYRQSYHRDRYHRVFEHMAGVYSVPL